MAGDAPKYKKWQGIALLVGAMVVFLIISADGVSAKNLTRGWMGMIVLTVAGAYVLIEARRSV